MPGTYRKRIYMSLVHTDSFRQTPICAHSTQKVNSQRLADTESIAKHYLPRTRVNHPLSLHRGASTR